MNWTGFMEKPRNSGHLFFKNFVQLAIAILIKRIFNFSLNNDINNDLLMKYSHICMGIDACMKRTSGVSSNLNVMSKKEKESILQRHNHENQEIAKLFFGKQEGEKLFMDLDVDEENIVYPKMNNYEEAIIRIFSSMIILQEKKMDDILKKLNDKI